VIIVRVLQKRECEFVNLLFHLFYKQTE